MRRKPSPSTFAAAVLAIWFTFASFTATLLAFSISESPPEAARVPHPLLAAADGQQQRPT